MLSKLRKGMLVELLWQNQQGVRPNKAAIVGFDQQSLVSNRVRAYRYKVVEQLLEEGYIQDKGVSGNYELVITKKGEEALNE